jgi:ribosomal protein S18 acetylase RimI-like enzyme
MGCPTEAAAHVGEIVSIYVRTGYQRQGIGRRLVQAVAAHLAQHGMTTLQIGTLRANTPARRFYESLGGCVIGERTYEEGDILEPGLVYGWTDIADLIPQKS